MEIATIAPAYDLELSDRISHTFMALQFLCKTNPQYRSYFSNIKRNYNDAYVILDNNANEGCLCSGIELINTAYDIFADEMVCPDEYHNAKETINKTKAFLDEHYDKHIKNKFNTMAVLQGETEEDFLTCYNEFINDDRINILGVGYRNLKKPFGDKMNKLTPEQWIKDGVSDFHLLKRELTEDTLFYTLSRIFFLRNILNYKMLHDKNKKLHMLGLYNPYELSLYKKCLSEYQLGFIRGCDSAAACQAAQAGVVFDKHFGVKDKPKKLLNFEDRLSSDKRIIAEHNILVMKEWAR